MPFLPLVVGCVMEPTLEWSGPEDELVEAWWQNVDTTHEEFEGTCAMLQLDGDAYALVPSRQWMYKSAWSAGGPGVIDLLSGQLKLGHIDLERDGDAWYARYTGLLLGGMEAWVEPGCDRFDVTTIELD